MLDLTASISSFRLCTWVESFSAVANCGRNSTCLFRVTSKILSFILSIFLVNSFSLDTISSFSVEAVKGGERGKKKKKKKINRTCM